MKILHLYKDYYPVLGGIENHVRLLAEQQAAQGHRVEVLVNNTGPRTVRGTLGGVQVTKVGRWFHAASAPLSPWYPLEIYKRLYSKEPPDIIHIQAPYPVSEAAWLLGSYLPRFGKKRPRCVITYQSDVVKQQRILKYYAPILRRVLRRADGIIATSPNYIQSSPFLRPLQDKCRVVPLGIDYRRFLNPGQEKVEEIKARFRGPLILFVGRLRYYKGLQYLLEAMPQVEQQARLLVVGIGPMEESLRQQARALHLDERVTFLGEIPDKDLPAYYAASDLFVLPSSERSEAFGLVQLEAMASGLPVISTELNTGTSFVNQDSVTGLVIPPANPEALARSINRLLAEETTRIWMGQNARQRAVEEFSLAKVLLGVEKVYNDVLTKG